MSSSSTWLLALCAVASFYAGNALGASPQVESPRLRLLDDALVAESPDAVATATRMSAREIQRGFEAVFFTLEPTGSRLGPRRVGYDTARKNVITLGEDLDHGRSQSRDKDFPSRRADAVTGAAAPAGGDVSDASAGEKMLEKAFLKYGLKGPLPGPCQWDEWPGSKRWRALLEDGGKEALPSPVPGTQGYICFAREAVDENVAHLYLDCPEMPAAVDLGSLRPFKGQALRRVRQLKILPSGDIVVLASNDKVTALQHYEFPLIDSFAAYVQGCVARVRERSPYPALRLRTVASLYAFSEEADRGFDSIYRASDGCVYFGTMPHSPVRGTPIFRYDPKAGRLADLGDLDVLAGNVGPGRIPSMMHTAPVELDRRIYFIGQDPFYGSYEFPGMGREVSYAGSPLLLYDVGRGTFESLGVPIPSGLSIFRVVADPVRKALYLRQGYWKKDWHWYELSLDAAGRPQGAPRRMPFARQPSSLHVGPECRLYYCNAPDADKPADSQPFLSGWEISRYDPATGKSEKVASVDPLALMGPDALFKLNGAIEGECEWIPGQEGAQEVLGCIQSLGLVIKLDTRTGRVSRACAWFPAAQSFPLAWRGPMCLWKGCICWFAVDGNERPFRTTQLFVADIATGRVERYGALVDQHGRYVEDVTQAACDADGRAFLGGQVWGTPEDRTYCRRGRGAMPVKLDSAFLVLDSLPRPGVEAKTPKEGSRP